MASTVAKPVIHQPPKIKKPPPPSLQTSINGANPSKSSPSPLLSAKRNSVVQRQSPSSTPTMAPMVNGTGPRASIRQRRESHRNGSLSSRTLSAELDARDRTNGTQKHQVRPFVVTTPYILKKYRNCPPSMIIHLNQQNFKFEHQDGTFAYTSSMKIVLEHIRAQTIPHDLMEEFYASNIRFYEGCLIVQIHDHRSNSASPENYHSAKSAEEEKNAPFSIHKYNEHLTPSSYVPFTYSPNKRGAGTRPSSQGGSRSSNEQQNTSQSTNAAPLSTTSKVAAPKSKLFTTVLHHTPLSRHAEMVMFANTPMPTAQSRRQSQHVSQPPTPLSAIPNTPLNSNGPAAKRQKMMLNESNYHVFEADLLKATSEPLFLDPVENLEQATELLISLKHPLHQEKPPTPKTRKRTVAELAADEAQAAEEAEFMLIFDERLGSATEAAGSGVKGGITDAQAGAASFDGNFSRFKTIETIRHQHEERRKKEEKEAMMQRRQQEQETARRQEEEKNKEAQRRAEQARLNAQRAALQAQPVPQVPHNSQMNGVLHNVQQSSQPPRSSPVIRNGTPHSLSSPTAGNNGLAQAGVPMNVTSSAGGGSPPRPPSAVQHSIAQSMVPQRSQQGGSRHGTPQNGHATPAIPQATPIIRNVTPSSRVNNGSPVPAGMGQMPMAGPQMNGVHMNNNAAMQFQRAQAIQMAQQQAAAQMHNGQHINGNHQMPQVAAGMTPQQQQQLMNQQAILRQQQAQQHAQQQQQQQARLVQMQQQGMQPSPQPNQMGMNAPNQMNSSQARTQNIIQRAAMAIFDYQNLLIGQWRQQHPGMAVSPQAQLEITRAAPPNIASLPRDIIAQARAMVSSIRQNRSQAANNPEQARQAQMMQQQQRQQAQQQMAMRQQMAQQHMAQQQGQM